MIDVKISPINTGACPVCIKKNKCRITDKLIKTMKHYVDPVKDDTMEIVIYRCPEFKEGGSF